MSLNKLLDSFAQSSSRKGKRPREADWDRTADAQAEAEMEAIDQAYESKVASKCLRDGSQAEVSSPTLASSGDLARIGRKHGTDKITHHGYHRFFPRFVEPFRNLSSEYAMLEIGVENCKSVQTWKDYFPQLFIYGMDINLSAEEDRVKIVKADQSKASDLRRFVANDLKHPLCLVIDDGSHVPEHQLLAFDTLFPVLLEGGTYIVEDVETSYWTRGNIYGYPTRYGFRHAKSAVEVFKALVDEINQEFLVEDNRHSLSSSLRGKVSPDTRKMISTITFGQNCVIVTKKTAEELEEFGDRDYRFKTHL